MEPYFDEFLSFSSSTSDNSNTEGNPDQTQEIQFFDDLTPEESTSDVSNQSSEVSDTMSGTNTGQIQLPNGIIIEPNTRSISEALTLGGATYTREQRDKLSADQKSKFVKSATEPTFTKFSIIDFSKSQSDKFLEENFSFMTQVDSLRRHLQLYGLIDVFQISDVQNPTEPAIDILNAYSTTPLNKVQEWSKMLYKFADKITLENLQLSQMLLMNACDDELQTKVNGELSVMPHEFRSGPTAFLIIARNIVVTTEKTIRAFTYHLQRLKLNQIPGEDVGKFISIFKGAANRLKAAGHLPIDTCTLAYEGLRSGTVFSFRQILEVKWIMKSPEMKEWDGVLDTAQIAYQELVAENQWLTKKKQGSSFTSHGTPEKDNKNHNNKSKNGNGNGKKNSNNQKIDRRAPKKGEPTSRTNESSGKEEHWCGKCREGGRWGNHKTADHDQWQENFKQMLKERKEQNKGNKKDKSPAKNSSDGPPSSQNLRPALRSSSYFSNFSRHSNI